ncbi:MAG TPA: glycosyltransferase [Bryobacteraceae bacterium]|nr:glycosyltransferase [Bryobacteraceae bacterium]
MLTAIIPSTNRASVLHETVASLARQACPPDEILLSVVDPGRDVLTATLSISGVRVIAGPKGSTCQRNTAIDNLRADCTLVSFFDDDIELQPDYLFHCRSYLSLHPEVVGVSGNPLADGTLTGEIAREEAMRLLRTPAGDHAPPRSCFALSGFDMTVRKTVAEQVRFDERLSLYALYEDFDFSVRCKQFGCLMIVPQCLLVHLRTGASRISAVRLGYAQLVNPLYLWQKGSQAWYPSLRICARSLTGNVLGCLIARRGIPRAERRRRLWGNALGLRDVLRRGPRPECIRQIQ